MIIFACACSFRQDEPPADIDGQDPPAPPVVEPTVRIEPITNEHRAVPGAMFGGWGPHLGHLLSIEGTTYWVDDLCAPGTPGDCDVLANRRVGVFVREPAGWRRLATIPLAGVQQNTAAIAIGKRIHVYGIASADRRVVECTYDLTGGASGCAQIPVALGPAPNYVGAAVAPGGSRVVWWTEVVDGGGGSFAYLVNYGGGWNGPRTGPVGGYNDCSYAHAGFAARRGAKTGELFCQVVSGLAPNWSFATLVGTAPVDLSAPVVWTNGLAPPAGDAIASTNDLIVDAFGDAHLIARSAAGAAVYYHKPSGGAYAPVHVVPAAFRARLIPSTDHIAFVRDVDRKRISIRRAPRPATAGSLALDAWPELIVSLPEGFGDIYAIYPLAPQYQDGAIPRTEFAVVGSGDEHLALYIGVE